MKSPKALIKKTSNRHVIVIGSGPAGLTAGYELTRRGFAVTILESDAVLGGIARTVEHNGFRFDIGGHRFFSKNKDIEAWWKEMLDKDFLVRPRLSRWYYRGNFFHYPIRPIEMLKTFGFVDSLKIILSYLRAKLLPIRPERSLADWCINNFGQYLAQPFFINYNLKLWGIHPSKLSKDFAFQRIKGVSFFGVFKDWFKKLCGVENDSVKSLINAFEYPRYGPGQMWEATAKKIRDGGGTILIHHKVTRICRDTGNTLSVTANFNGSEKIFSGDFVLSTMPLKELVVSISPEPPQEVLLAAKNLLFRDFITVALMIHGKIPLRDTWVYTHEENFRSIRAQLFQNWSPFMVPSGDDSCVGFEYTCSENDSLWKMSDEQLIKLAKSELEKLDFVHMDTVFDARVIRMRNVYPTYDLEYRKNVETIRKYLTSEFKGYSLQPIGRGGLHKYNNSDHSMMTAILAVKNIAGEGRFDPWNVNSDAQYHEEILPRSPEQKFHRSTLSFLRPVFITVIFGFLLFLRTRFLLKGFWIDEWLTVEKAQQLFQIHLANPYHAIIFPLVKWFGSDEIGLRSVSIFFNLLSAIGIYFTGRKFFGKLVGLSAAAIFMAFPYSLILSQEIRMYSFLSFLSVIHLFQILSIFVSLQNKETLKTGFLLQYLLIDVALLFVHFSSALLIGVETIVVLSVGLFSERNHRFRIARLDTWKNIIFLNAVSILLFSLWDWKYILTKIGFFSRNDTYIERFVETTDGNFDKIIAIFNATIGFSSFAVFTVLSLSVLIVTFLFISGHFQKESFRKKVISHISILFIVLVSLAYYLFDLFVVRTLVPRHFFIVSPLVAILFGVLVAFLTKKNSVLGASVFFSIFSISLANAILFQRDDALSSNRSWDALSLKVIRHERKANAVFVHEPFLTGLFAHYYQNVHAGKLPVKTLDDYEKISDNPLIRNGEIGVSFFNETIVDSFIKEIEPYQKIFLIRNGTVMSDQRELLLTELRKEYSERGALCVPERKHDLCAILFEKN